METKSLLPCSQEHAAGPYLEPNSSRTLHPGKWILVLQVFQSLWFSLFQSKQRFIIFSILKKEMTHWRISF